MVELRTDRLVLKEFSLTNLEKIHQLHSLPETDRFNTMGIPASIEETGKVLEKWMEEIVSKPRKRYVFCIYSESNDFVGLIGINMGKPAYRNAELWYKIHPEFWNRGFATEVVNQILHFCFNVLKLHRISAGCAVENVASIRVLEKSGMRKEGHCRKILPIRGEWVDNYEFAILEEDFLQKG